MLTAQKLGYEINSHEVFSDVSFSISERDKVGLIGPNGAGKTTLLRILSGEIEPTEGTVIREDVEVGILPQNLESWHDRTVYDFIEDVTGVRGVREDYDKAEAAYNVNPNDNTLINYSDAGIRLGHFGVHDFEGTLTKSLKRAGLDTEFSDREIGSLSGGQRTRVALAAIMAARYDVILLDEPTNNLDLEGISKLERFINLSNAAFLMVSHDRRFLRNATTRIVELLGGNGGVNQYGLGYDEYVEARINSYEADLKRYEEHKIAVKGLQSSVRDKKVKANSADRGGSKRSDGDKLNANFRAGRASGHLASQAKALESRLERLKAEAPRQPQPPISLDFMFQDLDLTSNKLLDVNDLLVSYSEDGSGDTFGPYDLHIQGGDRVAIVGANGTGKSTLVKTIMGDLKPQEGSYKLSPSARVAYMDQDQSLPEPDASPVNNLMVLAPEISREDAMHLLVKFNFDRNNIDAMKARDLSGGERAKVLLASVAANKANLLILDEPTNNIDIPTIEGLQDALATYKGAILLISHDREFMDGIGINKTLQIS